MSVAGRKFVHPTSDFESVMSRHKSVRRVRTIFIGFALALLFAVLLGFGSSASSSSSSSLNTSQTHHPAHYVVGVNDNFTLGDGVSVETVHHHSSQVP